MKNILKYLAAGLVGVTLTATVATAEPTEHNRRPKAPQPASRPKQQPKPRPPQQINPKPKQPGTGPKPTPKPKPKPGPGGSGRPGTLPAKPRPGTNGGMPSVTIKNTNTNSNTNTNNNANVNRNGRTPAGNRPGTVDRRPGRPRDGRNGPGDIVIRPRLMPGTGGLLVPGGAAAGAAAADPGFAAAPPAADPGTVYYSPPAPTGEAPTTLAPEPAEPELTVNPTPLVRLTERRLAIRNTTNEALRVYVQRYSRTDEGTWTWLPADPRASKDAVECRVEGGRTATLTTDDGDLIAQRVRLWAVSDSGREWELYRDADLVLVPERDAAGRPAYQAAAIETVTLKIEG